ncbi:c-type cytochrome [Adhaeretor mobilis]|uniref:Cytochrome c n=1 Tax=Adhaeretor mobilis TaxID=1930276 RepID=A0A517MZ83_9BACT|nr:c-type cytochrome [Adhaeretor mobilis]QDT00164.1 Cytochrome c [Adhaeretor mobilis]
MPATEQTWYNQKLMHVIFGATALIMTVATFWLLAKDHNREWKDVQLADRRKDAWMIEAEREKLVDQLDSKMADIHEDIFLAASQPVEASLAAEFLASVAEEDIRLAEGDQQHASQPELFLVTEKDPETGDEQTVLSFENAAELNLESADDMQDVVEAYRQLRVAANISEQAAAKLIESGEEPDEAIVKTVRAARREVKSQREALLAEMQDNINEAKRREDVFVGHKKIANGERTAALSELTLLIGHGGAKDDIEAKQKNIDKLDETLATLTAQVAGANQYRLELESIVTEINADRDAVAKELGTMETELSRLEDLAYKNTTNWKEWITRAPVLNALYDGNIRIQQNWLPDLTINYNFSQVARFDRCITCHRAISKTAPGTATDPAYPSVPKEQREFTAKLITPDEKPESGATPEETFRDTYGAALSESGIIDEGAVSVHYVLPETPAALAGLESGDVIEAIGDSPVYETETVYESLLNGVENWGEPIELKVKRGLKHPFTSHPRLDLYLTDLSPHPENKFGCTICHDGQGSGTTFKWASHTPNTAKEQNEWSREHEWFDNHHWIFPMKPARFAESNCMKCHHEKGELEPSEKFPDPPAPKLVSGWSTVEQFGCFGCHEINGYDGPDDRIGPDVRLEPSYYEAAAALLSIEELSDEERILAERVVDSPSDSSARKALLASVVADGNVAATGDEEARLPQKAHKLSDLLKTAETPGQYRKVGPSLRYVKSKVGFDWLYSWIRKPADFRPSTKMPQFFGLTEHLEGSGDHAELAKTHAFEPIEIRAITKYLLDNSAEFEYLEPPEGITEDPSAERGKWLFQTRGCLACHSHEGFEGIHADQGPELSEIAAKFDNKQGKQWLYSWLKQPHKYHARTKMPNLYLEPIEVTDPQGEPTGEVTDPAADIAEYLLGVRSDWKPEHVPAEDQLTQEEQQALSDLALEWLASPQIPTATAKKFLEEGIPEKFAQKVKEDERILVGITDENRVEKQLQYVGRRSIAKYGCFGCHDIPGYEAAKPIGAALAEWGRKEPSKLAFENIQAFLSSHGIDPAADDHQHAEHDTAVHGDADEHSDDEHASHGHLDPQDFAPDDSYFVQALNSHSRDGFLWQKLRYPRSYDYKTTANKGYNERLRMPKFPFTDEQREEVMTFLLGLVNEPPAEQYIFQPDARQQAIVEGRQVLDKYNCAGCHTMRMENWNFAYDGDAFDSPTEVTDFPFLAPTFDLQQIAASMEEDNRGLLFAELHGMPVMDEETGEPQLVDEDGLAITREEVAEIEAEEGETIPTFYNFTLWENALLNGEPWVVGVQDVMVPAAKGDQVGPTRGEAYAAWGGDLARYLFPHVIAKAKEANPQAKGSEAWGWLPPPLMDEGEKVQPAWLHGFLMSPKPLRPAVVMRMPNFKMSSDDASKLVNYFAAASNAEFPYEYNPHQQQSYLTELSRQREDPLGEAMQVVTNGNYCVKCHGVADYMPKGDVTTLGPNLAEVGQRLRPEFLRNWIANPKHILPYTGMPVNIPYNPNEPHLGGLSQELFHGTSIEQVRGLVDLLLNFGIYAQQQTSISELVEESAAQTPPEAENAAGNADDAASKSASLSRP